jgi:hypothetical protein
VKQGSIGSVVLLTGLLFLSATAGLVAQESVDTKSLVQLEAIVVEPSNPGPDTLCTLSVRVRNNGTEKASQFGFTVTLNGQELSVYGNQLFMYPVEPGASLEFPLYNFWTTETSRPTPPADGKLRLEIAIKESQWMKIEMEDEVEVWTPLGPVEDLPAGTELTVVMSSGS